MRARVMFFAGLLLVGAGLGIAVLWFLRGNRGAETVAGAGSPGENKPDVATPAPGAAVESRAPTTVREPDAPAAPTGAWRARVVSETSEPIAGVAACTTGTLDGATRKSTCASDVQGMLQSAPLPPLPWAQVVLRHPDFAPLERGLALVAGRTLDLGTLVLHRGGRVRGIVCTAGGDPVSGARLVSSSGSEALSDAAGAFLLAGLPDDLVWIEVEAAGLAVRPVPPILLHPGETVEGLRIVVEPALAVRGRVTDASGQPLENVRVLATLSLPSSPGERALPPVGQTLPQARTDASGAFLLAPLRAATLFLTLAKPGFRVQEVHCEASGEPLEVVLEGVKSLLGQVVDADAAPLTPTRVEVRSTGWDDDPDSSVWMLEGSSSDVVEILADGRFVAPVPEHPFRVLVLGEDFAPTSSPTLRWADLPQEGQNPLILHAERGQRQSGRVLHSDGSAAAEIDLVFRQQEGADAMPREMRTRSDSRGEFTTPPLAAGSYSLEVLQQGASRKVLEGIVVAADHPPAPLEIVLSPAGSLEGVLHGAAAVSESRGQIVAWSDGGAVAPEPALARWMGTDRFLVAGLEPGSYQLELVIPQEGPLGARERIVGGRRLASTDAGRAAGGGAGRLRASPAAPFPVRAGEVTTVELFLDASTWATVRGTVRVNDVPAPLCRITLAGAGGRGSRAAVSDLHGAFEFSCVEPGPVSLGAVFDGRIPVPVVQDFEVGPGEVVEKELALACGSITGRVLDEGTGSPATEAQVILVVPGPHETRIRTRPQADGSFSWSGVPAGPVDVGVALGARDPPLQRVWVAPGQTVVLADFQVKAPAHVLLRVTDPAGAIRAEALAVEIRSLASGSTTILQVAGADKDRGTGDSSYQGRQLTLPDLAPGEYEVVITRPAGEQRSVTLHAVPGRQVVEVHF